MQNKLGKIKRSITAGSVIATINRNYFEQFAVVFNFFIRNFAAMVPNGNVYCQNNN
jgi:hypothetical protein